MPCKKNRHARQNGGPTECGSVRFWFSHVIDLVVVKEKQGEP